MKIILNSQRQPAGFVLLLVVVLVFFTVMILAGVMNRTSTVSLLNLRSTQLNQLDSAAEAAVEKAYAKMAFDFQSAGGPGTVTNNLASYRTLVPTTTDNPCWGNYAFSDPVSGNTNSLYVGFVGSYTGPLPAQFTNQFAYNSPIYRIAANVKQVNSLVDVTGTAQEDVLLALVPITTYAIFYNGELEFSDCATMLVNGRVHSNSDICAGAGSGATLTFNAKVTSVSTMSAPARGGISIWTPTDPSTWLTTFNAGYTTNNPVVNIAISMTNTHSIIDIPPPPTIEPVMSQQGQVRLYNEAQIVLVVTNSPLGGLPRVLLTMQTAYNGSLPGADPMKGFNTYDMTNQTDYALDTNALVVPTSTNPGKIALPFLSLTNTFVDQRQGSGNQLVTQIDVNQLNSWMTTNTAVTGKFSSGYNPTILYVADRRTTSAQAVVRLVNGAKLPYNNGLGFTVATPNPLYVKGNYNVTINSNTYAMGLGSTTNGSSVPAALLSDAITILSPNWNDAQSSGGYSSRTAASMTFNAALVTGNIPSTGTTATTFSGGVHNLTRFLEDWTGSTLTLNTSIVCLFSSKTASAQFQMPGAYYKPPTRQWGFDQTYYSPNKQPPGIPCALVPIRFNWFKPAPGSVTSN
ncbi:MAG: hypothetical protein P4N60_13295 [Verrucomicrobiae bacterium]|nr:hypothetical protein [Verrucomicrobiae bacterium]